MSDYASRCYMRGDDGNFCRNIVVTIDPARSGLCRKHADLTAKWLVNEREAARLIWAMQRVGLLAAPREDA
jgi:hypothetical protein